jgi:hypothetical protein
MLAKDIKASEQSFLNKADFLTYVYGTEQVVPFLKFLDFERALQVFHESRRQGVDRIQKVQEDFHNNSLHLKVVGKVRRMENWVCTLI